MSGKNVALLKRWFDEVWNQKRIGAIAEMASPECIAHGQAQHDVTMGLAQFEQFALTLQTSFPDMHVEFDFAFEQDDKVVARWTATMTHTGEFLEFAPTGRQAKVTGTTVARIADGKIVEGWDSWNAGGLVRRLADE